jgi:hypothetical protein
LSHATNNLVTDEHYLELIGSDWGNEKYSMKKLVLILMLAIASTSAMAEWTKVDLLSLKDGITHYVDLTTIIKAGNKAKMWQLNDNESAKTRVGRLSMKTQKEYDCGEEKIRTLTRTLFSGNMGTGVVRYSSGDRKPSNWSPVEPGSSVEVFWKIACGNARPVAKWTRVHEHDELGLTLYVNHATIRKSESRVKIWSLGDYKTVQETKMGRDKKKYLSSKAQWEFNCKENKLRGLFFVFFSDNMSRGERFYWSHDESSVSGWMQVVRSPLEELWKIACGK